MKSELNKSISELEGWTWKGGIPSNNESYVVRNFFKLHKQAINEMDFLDIRFLIGQNSGLKYLVPIALEELKKDLFIEVEYYPGDLFCSLLLINNVPDYWSMHPQEKQELINLYTHQKKKLGILDISEDTRIKIKESYKDFIKK